MPAEIAIIHGWSDTSKSFAGLKRFLSTNGYAVAQIWLGDYISLDDDIRVEDVAKRMHAVLGQLIVSKQLTQPFDLIVHSTGGLVAREWVSTFYPDGANCPAKRIIMLAPANFGSRLGALGKSMIGRIAKGWNNWFQTGENMLRSLELASPYQWRLACRDLLDPTSGGSPGPYGRGKIWPFVISGTRAYAQGLRTIVNEDGSDGTVRAAAANLNAFGMTIDFSKNPTDPHVTPWSSRVNAAGIPFAVLPDRDHALIVDPASRTGASVTFEKRLGELILAALACPDDRTYERMHGEWERISEETHALASPAGELDRAFSNPKPEPKTFNQYMQFVVRARDDHGQPVNDFFLEFFAPETRGDAEAIYFHDKVLEHVHTNSVVPNHRCLFIDRTDLLQGFYSLVRSPAKRRLAVSVSAAKLGPNVRYFDRTKEGAEGSVLIHDASAEKREKLDPRLHRNTTHLVDLILPRQPIDKVFRLSR